MLKHVATMEKDKLFRYLLLGTLAALIATFLIPDQPAKTADFFSRDFAEIQKDSVIRIATEYNSIGFHVNPDSSNLSGFHYELIQAFAKHYKLRVDLTTEINFEQQLKGLTTGKYDLLANSIHKTSELKDSILLSHPLLISQEVLVQRKPQSAADSAIYIDSQLDLAGKTIHIAKGSPTIYRIQNLAAEIADTILIEEVEKYGPEQLIAMVAHGDIDYTVCDITTARAAADSLPQLDIHTAISFKQFYSWAVSKHSPVLLDSLNSWLDNYIKSKKYRLLYKRY
ncbi:glutamine ABC transporter, periplasmic glutamine-binding protein, partial [gut metagenome]